MYAETDDGKTYQRASLDHEKNELTLEAGFSYWAQPVFNNVELYTVNPVARIEYAFNKQHSLSAVVPYYLSFYDEGDLRPNARYSVGDVQLSYEYVKKITAVNWTFGSTLQIPAAASSEYAAREGIYTVGSGRFAAGVMCAASAVRDPIVWTLSAAYTVGFPKQERFYTPWQPGDMQLSATLLHLLNERFALSLALRQTASLPQINGNKWDAADFSTSTLLSPEALILFEDDYVKLSADLYLFPRTRSAALSFAYGHTFKSPKSPKGETP
jgi:hypothetical protein